METLALEDECYIVIRLRFAHILRMSTTPRYLKKVKARVSRKQMYVVQLFYHTVILLCICFL